MIAIPTRPQLALPLAEHPKDTDTCERCGGWFSALDMLLVGERWRPRRQGVFVCPGCVAAVEAEQAAADEAGGAGVAA